MIQQTSLKTYTELRKEGLLGLMQKIVLTTIIENPDSTDKELAAIIQCDDANNVRPRRNELAEQGLIYANGKRECTITGRTATTWKAY